VRSLVERAQQKWNCFCFELFSNGLLHGFERFRTVFEWFTSRFRTVSNRFLMVCFTVSNGFERFSNGLLRGFESLQHDRRNESAFLHLGSLPFIAQSSDWLAACRCSKLLGDKMLLRIKTFQWENM
jgi:hypothetical protein